MINCLEFSVALSNRWLLGIKHSVIVQRFRDNGRWREYDAAVTDQRLALQSMQKKTTKMIITVIEKKLKCDFVAHNMGQYNSWIQAKAGSTSRHKVDIEDFRWKKGASFYAVDMQLCTWFCYWQGSRLAIHRPRVQVLSGNHCIVGLDKLPVPVCLCYEVV